MDELNKEGIEEERGKRRNFRFYKEGNELQLTNMKKSRERRVKLERKEERNVN